ncbi:hypothetical protein ACFV29_03915 [Streptomyces sp. NPDC059690]|uniref:hypothetical protein n=1 Tax=Streptomyces sp. NPDC059690 TaxID=3346907 RepID=UPI0036CEF57E
MKTTPVWFDSLTDSVYALGAAAREAQRAARAAELERDAYSPDRIRLLDAEVHVDGRAPGSVPFRPHDAAVFTIGDTIGKAVRVLRGLYVNTALAYGYGTAWAILRVLDGQQPAAVSLRRSADGHCMLPPDLCPVLPAMPALQRWNDYVRFEQARLRLVECDSAGCHAEFLDCQAELSDHEAAELHAALDVAAGEADAAYAYGVLAESALHFALLEPKAQHARTLA